MSIACYSLEANRDFAGCKLQHYLDVIASWIAISHNDSANFFEISWLMLVSLQMPVVQRWNRQIYWQQKAYDFGRYFALGWRFAKEIQFMNLILIAITIRLEFVPTSS